MKKIKEMQAEHVYLIRGASTARSPFFEDEQDCGTFLAYADRFLKDYMRVVSFQNSRDGWVMIVATKSAQAIKRAYLERRAKSKKCRKEFEFTEVWQMLSDQIRILLSTYVKVTNFRTRRKGAKVRCRYERFVFESEAEAKFMQASLEKEFHDQAQPQKRYRPSYRSHKIRKWMLKASIYISCALLGSVERMKKLGMGCLDLGYLDKAIARQAITNTLKHHFPT